MLPCNAVAVQCLPVLRRYIFMRQVVFHSKCPVSMSYIEGIKSTQNGGIQWIYLLHLHFIPPLYTQCIHVQHFASRHTKSRSLGRIQPQVLLHCSICATQMPKRPGSSSPTEHPTSPSGCDSSLHLHRTHPQRRRHLESGFLADAHLVQRSDWSPSTHLMLARRR